MEDVIVVIICKSYSQGSIWLRGNHKALKLDAQKCRITNNPDVLKGLTNYRIIWLRGWGACTTADRIRREAESARAAGRIVSEMVL